jgi:acetyl-CoA carboxylase biotin carboxyl carrier protein
VLPASTPPTMGAAPVSSASPTDPAHDGPVEDGPVEDGPVEDGAATGGSDDGGLVSVVAPLPGTFYRAPRPGAPPFVEVGDAVGPDTVVAIIETMKLMNSVPAGTSGRVARIVLENGELAALGTTLMLIEPDSPTPTGPPP